MPNNKKYKTSSIAEEAARLAVREMLQALKEKEIRERKRNVFQNTELLLRHYNDIRKSIECSVSDLTPIFNESDDLETEAEKIYARSIRYSKTRSLIIISHIDSCIEELRKYYQNQGEESKMLIIDLGYIKDPAELYEDIAAQIPCSLPTFRKYKREVINKLSVLLFGADALKIDL